MKKSCCRTLCLILALATSPGAHSGERLYPIPELTDEMLEKIQLNDGSADEWYDLVGEPTMSLVDFRKYGTIPDPSDLDFRIWLAWHDDPDRLYVAFLGSDDVYFESPFSGHDVELQLTIDGNHSGGGGYSNLSFDEAEGVWGESQQYRAMARTATGDPALSFLAIEGNGEHVGVSIWFYPYMGTDGCCTPRGPMTLFDKPSTMLHSAPAYLRGLRQCRV